MNFNQKPGIYNAVNDEFIAKLDDKTITYSYEKVACDFFYETNSLFYIIFPDNITDISSYCFNKKKNLVGISGKNIEFLAYYAFCNCNNLEVVDFPNLKGCDLSFVNCPKFDKKYIDENNLVILNNNCLISASKFKGDKLIVSNNIKYIATCAFYNCKAKEIVFPLKVKTNSMDLRSEYCVYAKKIILPIELKTRYDWILDSSTKYIFKGNERQLNEMLEYNKNTPAAKLIINEPYTIKELQNSNFSLKEIEQILDRKLTLDEILNFNHSMKEANEYFKDDDIVL